MAEQFCEICGKALTKEQIYRHRTVCSRRCSTIRQFRNPENRKKISESVKKAFKNPEIKQKHKQAMSDWANRVCTTPEYKENMSKTLKEVYKSTELREKISKAVSAALLKPEVNERLRKAIQKAYENPEVHIKLSNSVKLAFSKPKVKQKHKEGVSRAFKEHKLDILQKQYKTKKKRGTFTFSSTEQVLLDMLKLIFSDIQYQYASEAYPFTCDFYIPSLDLYIEYHGSWTHGGRPYNEKEEWCKSQLEHWQEKAKTSKFYQNAIYTWTDLDVRKASIAKDNALNWICFYSFEEFKQWIINIGE